MWLEVFELQLLLCSSSLYAAELENKLHLTFSTSALRIWGVHLAVYKVFSEVFEEKAGWKKQVLGATADKDKMLNFRLLLIFRQSCAPWVHVFSSRAKHNELYILHCHEHFLFSSKAVQRDRDGETHPSSCPYSCPPLLWLYFKRSILHLATRDPVFSLLCCGNVAFLGEKLLFVIKYRCLRNKAEEDGTSKPRASACF